MVEMTDGRGRIDAPISRRAFAAAAGVLPLLLFACSGANVGRSGSASGLHTHRSHTKKRKRSTRAAWPQAARNEVDALVQPYAGKVSLICTPLDANSFAPLKGGFAIDASTQRTAASLIKLAILAAAIDAVAAGTLSLDESITVAQQDIVGGAGDIRAKGAGASYTVDELLHAMIAQSDNTAANLIIDKLGMDAVNAECAKLKLRQTGLRRLMMDEAARQAGRENTISAKDAATLLERIAAGTIATPELCEHARSYLLDQRDTAGITQGLPDGTQIAHKTGSLAEVQHDAAIVYGDKPYVLVVLTQGMERAAALDLMRGVSAAIWRAAVS